MKFLAGLLLIISIGAYAASGHISNPIGPFIWGPGGTAQSVAPNGVYPSIAQGSHVFDDFISGQTNTNFPIGQLGWFAGSNASGYIANVTGGISVAGTPGRIGILGLGTGTTNNATAQAFVSMAAAQLYSGIANITIQFAAQMPTVLSTVGTEYIVDMGLGTYPFEQSGNGLGIVYSRLVSTNFAVYTINNGTQTTCTTADAAHFAVVANTWYNFKIVMPATGGAVSFYVAPSGTFNYVLLCTINTNLPDVGNQAYPVMEIYKAPGSAATTTNRIFNVDWWSMDVINASNR